jgi:hypothetical protein
VQKAPKSVDAEAETLKDQARNSLDESRMVLPGIQAVFGFQLIAVFNERFDGLDIALKLTHLTSLCLVVVAMALLMTPAAYDRIAEPDYVSANFLRRTAWFLTIAMAALACAVAVEMYVIVMLVTARPWIAFLACAISFGTFVSLWFVGPWRARKARTNAD